MKITLTPQESEKFFYNALCNGLSYIRGYGLEMDYSAEEFKTAKKNLYDKNEDKAICYEDILMQLLRDGGKLTLLDEEDDNTEYSIILQDVHERVQNTPARHLIDMETENDDADTADAILQTVFLKEIIFG